MTTNDKTWPVAGLLFASGFCALVYQIGWLREFRLIFGASTAASAAVLAIFIGGLGFGGWLLGRRADAHPRPLAFYAQLEAVVALSAAASPLLLTLVRQLYVAIGGTPRLGLSGGTIVRLLLSTVVLVVPTVAMGGTLPAAARAITGARDQRRRQLAALYGCNTLGAVTGCVVATFFALELFGTRSTLWLAAGVNLLVAVFARQVDRTLPEIDAVRVEPAISAEASAPIPFVLVASGVVGFAFFLMELVWYRMLAPLLGGSVFTFGLILAVALAGVGAGGLAYSVGGADRPASVRGFALTCLLEAAAIAFAFALGDRLATLAMVLTAFKLVGFGAQVAGWTLVTAIVVLPASFVAGYQFPLLIALLGRGRDHLGRQLGLAYATNTVGAIVGSLAGGFGLLPWLSAPGAWRLVAASLLLLGTIAALIGATTRGVRSLIPQAALIAVTTALLFASGPTAAWRHSAIGAGRAPLQLFSTPNNWEAWTHTIQRVIVWEHDGVESSVALASSPGGYAFVVNGKSDGDALSDAGTAVMLGLLGPILNPAARHAMVIGLGTGMSAGWLAAVPSIDRVDVVELEPLIVDVARACTSVNHDVLANPKVRLTIGDAREALLVSHEQYDVIASEPSNPFRAGVASLFTEQYYRAAFDRLSPDGVFVQWTQDYEVDTPTLKTIYATLANVFPHLETWQTTSGDLALVGAKHPITHRADVLAARIREEPFTTALRAAWHTTSIEGFLSHYVAGDGLARAIASTPNVPLNDDDRNVVEFGFARALGKTGTSKALEIRAMARRLGFDASALNDAPQSARLWTGLVSFYAASGFTSAIPMDGPPSERARQEALRAFYERHDVATARTAWQQQSEGPRDPVDLAMLAMIEASSASDAALPYIDHIRSYEPAEADAILAMLLARQGKTEHAAATLESALTRMAVDPWPLQLVKERALTLAQELGAKDPTIARRLIAVLKTPFAAGAMPDERLRAAAALARTAGLAQTCVEPLHAFEPHVPWTLEMLVLRRDCYAAAGDPLLTSAERDLQTFARLEPQPFFVLHSAQAH